MGLTAAAGAAILLIAAWRFVWRKRALKRLIFKLAHYSGGDAYTLPIRRDKPIVQRLFLLGRVAGYPQEPKDVETPAEYARRVFGVKEGDFIFDPDA